MPKTREVEARYVQDAEVLSRQRSLSRIRMKWLRPISPSKGA
ncbi:hypothetical protein MPY17_40465 [Rhodococcus opacus]|nr:hypothetical protein [Rhodococcus opacus]UUK33925.1 hypothetical protein MPY17_40465 [Rhodococcus opacus]